MSLSNVFVSFHGNKENATVLKLHMNNKCNFMPVLAKSFKNVGVMQE